MTLLVDDILDTLKTRYGQTVTDLEDFFTHKEDLEIACKTAISEYSYYRPQTRIMKVQGSPNGVYLGDDVINVRNIRMTNNYFDKISPKLSRRYKSFDKDTHIFSCAYTMPLTIEVACTYTMHRVAISNQLYSQALQGDSILVINLKHFVPKTLKISVGTNSWSDADNDYEDMSECYLSPATGTIGSALLNIKDRKVVLKDLSLTEDSPIYLSYNPVFSTIEGLDLRDKLFIDLCVGHCLVSLGNIKTQLQMEGDVVNFNGDNLVEQGQALINATIESLEGSSTTYANL